MTRVWIDTRSFSYDLFSTFFSMYQLKYLRVSIAIQNCSSPEPKAKVSFSDQNLSVVVVVYVVVVVLVVNFSHFHLLLKNHWANFNQSWHKASLVEGDSSLFKKGPALFQGEIITKW